MQYTTLPKTDLRISKVGIGTNKIGGHNIFKNLDENEGKDFLKEALSLGVNFIDTADYYGLGRSEELIGEVLQSLKLKREELVIATKGGMQWNAKGEISFNNSPDYLRQALDASLKRLQTDFVDLYYLHFPDKKIPFSESIGELVRLKEEGKIREIAASNLTLEQLKEVNNVTEIVAFQSTYNMFERDAEKDIIPYCVENQISYLPYFPLSSGLLGGNYSLNDTPPKSIKPEEFRCKVEVAEKLKLLAETKGTSLPNLALAWLLAQDGIDAVIPGGRRPNHAAGNVKAVDVSLNEVDLNKIEDILKQTVQF